MPRRHPVAALAAAAFAIPLAFSLSARIPAIRRAPLNPESREGGFSATLRGGWAVEGGGTFYVPRIHLRTSEPRRLLAHDEIGLQLLGPGQVIDMQGAEIAFLGTTCAYHTAPDPRFIDAAPLMFARGPECTPVQGEPTGELRLSVRLRDPKGLAVRTLPRTEAEVAPGSLVVSRFGLEAPPGVLLAQGTIGD